MRPSQQQEPLLSDDDSTRPFESVSADFFTVVGKSFLVIADRLSGWPVVVPCGSDTMSAATIRQFRYYFRDVGVPVRLRTDRGPQLTSRDFAAFLDRWGVRHMVSSPHYPQSNGHAEAASFLMEWQTKTEICGRRAANRAQDVVTCYNAHARPLPRLKINEQVRIQDPTSLRWDKVGTIMGNVIRAESLEVLVVALDALHEWAKPLGLEVSWLKTKVQALRSPGPTATEGTNSTRLSNKMEKELERWCSEK
ncbi:hypothetical protein GWK47_038385 [Chionoecetes opilio]|uniref:Integrase catalytic domain-containing protein n=1 Tax=Chionoecetes opilio TaxID=41210 RepID=A0A8J5CYA7_CHIOP|nr:hypothetical protein GWK47_038385 [Chionoecetes opilio]